MNVSKVSRAATISSNVEIVAPPVGHHHHSTRDSESLSLASISNCLEQLGAEDTFCVSIYLSIYIYIYSIYIYIVTINRDIQHPRLHFSTKFRQTLHYVDNICLHHHVVSCLPLPKYQVICQSSNANGLTCLASENTKALCNFLSVDIHCNHTIWSKWKLFVGFSSWAFDKLRGAFQRSSLPWKWNVSKSKKEKLFEGSHTQTQRASRLHFGVMPVMMMMMPAFRVISLT